MTGSYDYLTQAMVGGITPSFPGAPLTIYDFTTDSQLISISCIRRHLSAGSSRRVLSMGLMDGLDRSSNSASPNERDSQVNSSVPPSGKVVILPLVMLHSNETDEGEAL